MSGAPTASRAIDELDAAVERDPGMVCRAVPATGRVLLPTKPVAKRASGMRSTRRQSANTGSFGVHDQRSLGQLLVDVAALTRKQVDDALTLEMSTGRRFAEILASCGYISEQRLASLVSRELALPWVAPHLVLFRHDAGLLLPRWVAEEFCLLGVHLTSRKGHGATFFVATDDPTDRAAMDACADWTQMKVQPMVALGSEIRRTIHDWYGHSAHRSKR